MYFFFRQNEEKNIPEQKKMVLLFIFQLSPSIRLFDSVELTHLDFSSVFRIPEMP